MIRVVPKAALHRKATLRLAMLRAMFWVVALGLLSGSGCEGSGTVVLVTVAGLDSKVAELGVVATLDNGTRQQFPRQSLAQSLSQSQQFGVLLPAGAGGAVSIEVDGYLGDCLIQSGQAPVALSGDPLLSVRVTLGTPAACIPLTLDVQGPGVITSRDVPTLNCSGGQQCSYFVDPSRSFVLSATATAGEQVIVDWSIDGVPQPSCTGQLQCPLTVAAGAQMVQVKAVFNPLCDSKLTLSQVAAATVSGTSLHAVWGIAGQEAWAVGETGAVMRARGTSPWAGVTLLSKTGVQVVDTLTGIWGVGTPATLFIVGKTAGMGGVSHQLIAAGNNSNTTITADTSQAIAGSLYGVSGFSLSAVWTVGTLGTSYKWNETTKLFEAPMLTSSAPSADLNGAWVADDAGHTLWAVSDKSQLFNLSGSVWTSTPAGGGSNVKLNGAAGDSTAVYGVGPQATVVRMNRTGLPMIMVYKVASVPPDSNRTLNAVWAGNGYVFTVGDQGSVFCSRSSGEYWTRLPVTGVTAPGSATFFGVHGSGNKLWVVGQTLNTGVTYGVILEATLP